MRTIFLLIVTIFFSLSIHCQNFIGVTKSNEGQTINLANDQVLEIKLPCKPSTGFGWYPILNQKSIPINRDKNQKFNDGVIAQMGDWEFLPEQNGVIVGQQGAEVIRFIGVSQGTSELVLEYKRPWEKNKPSVDIFKLTLNSNGKYTGKYSPQSTAHSPQTSIIKSSKSTLPSSFSWQSQCTPIKDQGECGSCWAFASTGCFEAIINIIDGNIRSLSEQWLINCDINANGCQGATSCPNNYLEYPGAVYESDLSYADSSCSTTYGDTARCMGACITYTYHEKADTNEGVNPTVDQIKQAIYNYGPVWACVDAGINFIGYTGSVDTNSDGAFTNHAVALVGWKDSILGNGISGYWILKNSWGSKWGEHGYMRIGYGVSAIGAYANYIVYKGGITSCTTGIPTPGNTISSANQVCSYETFTLSLQNFTNRVKYQWESSPDDSTWTNISGATNPTYTYVATQPVVTWYRCNVTCSGDTGTSNAVKETVNPPPTTPTAGKLIPSENQIIWNWNPVLWATGYKWNTLNDYNSATGNGTSTSYTQTGLTSNTQYILYVWSYNICGNSAVGTLKESTLNTGIHQLTMNNEQLIIFPNPVTSELTIETSSDFLFNINLTNIVGQSIYNAVLNKKTVIDISNIPDGMYIIKIYNENETIVRKIMKE